MEKWMESMRSSASMEGRQVMVSGDPEWKAEAERLKNGIPVHPEVINDLKQLAAELELPEINKL
jgi:LDH2 family malate/lactate/ureidoglycolate dehydrogenase